MGACIQSVIIIMKEAQRDKWAELYKVSILLSAVVIPLFQLSERDNWSTDYSVGYIYSISRLFDAWILFFLWEL